MGMMDNACGAGPGAVVYKLDSFNTVTFAFLFSCEWMIIMSSSFLF
jgi:hypothetical protein